MKNIAIFASGGGSNAKAIVEFFNSNTEINVAIIVSNKADAKVLVMAQENNIPTLVINRAFFFESEQILQVLNGYHIDLIVLAGFLWKVPHYLVVHFEQKIINIHPALLPKYGGKGMYGIHVHEAVAAAKEKYSGITIHYVNENYDEGNIIFQCTCELEENDTPEIIAKKVLSLEHKHFAPTIQKLLSVG